MFGKKLPLATLFNAPTIAELASIITDENWSAPWTFLVEIQPGGSKPPFFCIHAAGGNVLNYRDLARHLGSDQPVYGLQAQGLDGKRPFLTRIEEMAAHYINGVLTVQSEGPYLLGGYCLGGTIALEMAQQLYAQGKEVALLALFETYNWANLPAASFLDKAYFCLQKIEFHTRNFWFLDAKGKMAFFMEKERELKRRSKMWYGMIISKISNNGYEDNHQDGLLSRLWETNDRAAAMYVPRVYPGRITEFRPIKQYARFDGPELGWDKIAAGGVETYELPFFPGGMLVEPFVQLLAKKLKICINNALGAEAS
jgi:pimeloyl-ACP methyl ester carboxylesterase